MTTKPPSRAAEQFVLRLPDGMRAQISEAAKANKRSMNSEIVARLQETGNSSQEDLDTIKSQALHIATLEFDLMFKDGEIQGLKSRLRIAAQQLEKLPGADPDVIALLKEYRNFKPAKSVAEERQAKMLKQIDIMKTAIDDLSKIRPAPPDKESE